LKLKNNYFLNINLYSKFSTMKTFTICLVLLCCGFTALATTWTITNSGFGFSPMTLTIAQGDTVIFDIEGIHNAVEVSQATYNANGTSPLSGGFEVSFGGGTVFPGDLSAGTHFYVCQPHASGGMKGTIIVTQTTATESASLPEGITIFPNPSQNGIFQLKMDGLEYVKNMDIEIFDPKGIKIYDRKRLATGATHELDLSEANSGIYLIKMYGDSRIYSAKLVVRK
jgi:plastocyanin